MKKRKLVRKKRFLFLSASLLVSFFVLASASYAFQANMTAVGQKPFFISPIDISVEIVKFNLSKQKKSLIEAKLESMLRIDRAFATSV